LVDLNTAHSTHTPVTMSNDVLFHAQKVAIQWFGD